MDEQKPLARSDPPTVLLRPRRERVGGFDQVSDAAYEEILAVLLDEAERLSMPQVSDEVIYQGKEGAA